MENKTIALMRFYRSGLIDKCEDVSSVLTLTLGVQAQYINFGLFNIFNRMKDPQQLLDTVHQNAILSWGQRQTVHFFDETDWLKFTQLLHSRQKWPSSYLTNRGYNIDNEVQRLATHLKQQNGLTRKQTTKIYGEQYKELFNWSCLWMAGSQRGNLYGKLYQGEISFRWREAEIPKFDSLHLEMVLRYIEAYGPVSKADIAHFFGVPQTFINADFEEYCEHIIMNNRIYYYLPTTDNIALPETLLVGKFDPLLVAYKHKEFLVPTQYAKAVWSTGGQIHGVIFTNGIYNGTWTFRIAGVNIDFEFRPLQTLIRKQKRYVEERSNLFAKCMQKRLGRIHYL